MATYDALRSDFNERVGDRERDITCNELVKHFSDGRLTEPEMQERTNAALSARTRGDLYALLSDLPRTRSVAPDNRRPHRSPSSSLYDVVLGFFSISAVICFILLTFLMSYSLPHAVAFLFLGALAGSVATLGICHFSGGGGRRANLHRCQSCADQLPNNMI